MSVQNWIKLVNIFIPLPSLPPAGPLSRRWWWGRGSETVRCRSSLWRSLCERRWQRILILGSLPLLQMSAMSMGVISEISCMSGERRPEEAERMSPPTTPSPPEQPRPARGCPLCPAPRWSQYIVNTWYCLACLMHQKYYRRIYLLKDRLASRPEKCVDMTINELSSWWW